MITLKEGEFLITFEEVGAMLDEIAEEMPGDFYTELNGGIFLSRELKIHPENQANIHNPENLYIVGEYHNDRTGYGGLGRYIAVYYGSFAKLYGSLDPKTQKDELRKLLIHEFTHHMESLAGEHGLEIKDAEKIERYKRKFIK
jgi:hypothetical protein